MKFLRKCAVSRGAGRREAAGAAVLGPIIQKNPCKGQILYMSLAFQGSPAGNPRDDVTASAAEAAVLLPQERVHLYFPYTTVLNFCQVLSEKFLA